MAWRFKASKYKNAAPIVPKPEACIRDICVGSYQTYGNNICASASFMAFNWEHVGSSMAVLPLDDCGRKSKTMPLLHAHSDTITDMEFSPFHDGLLLTGSQDSLVKVWHIPPEGLKESLSRAECSLSQRQRRVENVGWHPAADGLVHVAAGHDLALWDLTTQQEVFVSKEHGEVIQSTSWKKDGRLLATSCKDKRVRVLDPRAPAAAALLAAADSHQNIKDSRVVWLGDEDRILTTGFDGARLRQVAVRDVRRLGAAQRLLELDCSTGVLMPLYDADTRMLFLAGKGDTTILYLELTDREPYLVEGLRHSGEQTKGACLVPKRALRVMEGEVNRVLQLTGSSVVPIMYQVPRKSYREYHADLYPETAGPVTLVSAGMWLAREDRAVPTISLHPDHHRATQVHRGNLEAVVKEILAMPPLRTVEPGPLVTAAGEQPARGGKPQPPPPPPGPEPRNEDHIDFVNVKDMIKGMEQHKNPETNGFHRRITDNGHDKSNGDDTDSGGERDAPEQDARGERSLEKTESSDSSESLSRQAPKPLPRSSISEGGAPDEPADPPRPRPRTTPPAPPAGAAPATTGGYKPRLGPKPFSAAAGSEEFSFDKVFSVPAVPGMVKSDSASSPVAAAPAPTAPVANTPPAAPAARDDDKQKSLSPTSDAEPTPTKEGYTNGKAEEEGYRPGSPGAPGTPGTAQRRKLFETGDGNQCNQSIAERRRVYEVRSVSAAAPDCEPPPSPAPLRRRDSLKSRKSPEREEKRSSVPNVATKRTSTVFGKVSKFRHLTGTPGHKSTHVENIKNISRQISGECNGFYANGVRCAVPVTAGGAGGGGRVAVIELPRGATPAARAPPAPPGALHPALLHPAPLQDWAWDPFRDDRLIVACDDGLLREWIIPENGLQESTNAPARTWAAHPDKIYIVRFHPTADGLLATAAHDLTVKLWELGEQPPAASVVLAGHTDQIFALDWSPCGDHLATVCKDGLIRIYSPRTSAAPLRSGPGPAGSRGARVVWALNGTHLVVTGFDKVSERQIMLYNAADLAAPVCTVGLDVSPAILQTHIDHDSATIFLTGRGDSTIYCYEVTVEAPHLCALSHHRAATLHQGIAFLQKNLVAVDKVEFARALRLTNGNIEPLSFTVPRIKSELFQDDLFPPTLVTWQPWQSARAWLAGRRAPPRTASLQPPGMEPLSAHTASPNAGGGAAGAAGGAGGAAGAAGGKPAQKPKPDLIKSHVPLDPKQQQDSILKSMSARVTVNLKLEQDGMEGVDEAEWDQ